MSRQRQNVGAVGQVWRAMVVISPSCRMRDALAHLLRQRRVAREAVAFAGQERADVAGVGGLGGFEFLRDAPGQPGHVRPTERGDGNLLVRAVNRHRLQRRLLDERVRDRAREAMSCLASGWGSILLRLTHVNFMVSIQPAAARCKSGNGFNHGWTRISGLAAIERKESVCSLRSLAAIKSVNQNQNGRILRRPIQPQKNAEIAKKIPSPIRWEKVAEGRMREILCVLCVLSRQIISKPKRGRPHSALTSPPPQTSGQSSPAL